jgi:hypothetical protein
MVAPRCEIGRSPDGTGSRETSSASGRRDCSPPAASPDARRNGMNRKSVVWLALTCIAAGSAVAGPTLAERLLTGLDPVQSVSCRVRKDTKTAAGTVRTLSRVYYQRPDRLHVDNYSPVARTIVSDGANFASYAQGDPKAFLRPVEKLDTEMLIQLRKVPGTAMDHLAKLRGVAETNLPPQDLAERKGYDAGSVFVVLGADATGRLARIEFYSTSSMKDKRGQYEYSDFQEVAGGAWIPCAHHGEFEIGGAKSEETVRIDNLTVNKPIAPNLFVIGNFVKDVEFVSSFEEIYR